MSLTATPRYVCTAVLAFLAFQHAAHVLGQTERSKATEPTSLTLVTTSVLEHFPRILAAQSDVLAKENLVIAAQGAFDARIDGTIGGRGGYYDNHELDTAVVQTLPSLNLRTFAGYRYGDGDTPVYDAGSLTRSGGEVRLGFAVSLMRDREIDPRRAAVRSARLDVRAEREEVTLEQLRVLRQAYTAYAQWLTAARLHESYVQLLTIAIDRGAALERRITAGDAPEILLVENRQAELQRRGLVVDAQRQIDVAAEQLALYLRDPSGAPMEPLYSPLLDMPAEDPAVIGADLSSILPRVLERHPDIAIARARQQEADIDRRLAQNLAKPQVDLRVYTSRDFGGGPLALAGTDNVADVTFSIPLQTRQARGQAGAAQAEIAALEHTIRLLSDQIEIDLRRARLNLDATREMEAFAVEELDASLTLAAAERQRFDAGLSDFFLLNQRERQVGEAQLKRWQAQFAHQLALADFYATGMHFVGFGAADLPIPPRLLPE